MRIKDILATIAVAALTACNNDGIGDDFIKGNMVLENQSQYTIAINKSSNAPEVKIDGVPQSITLKAGDSFVVEDFPSLSICKAWGYVVYDGVVALDFFSEKPYSTFPGVYSLYDITRPANYKMAKISRSRTEYRYTFTDADYQFALENGTMLE